MSTQNIQLQITAYNNIASNVFEPPPDSSPSEPSSDNVAYIKEELYRIWGGVNRLGDSGVHTLSNTLAFVIPAGQLLLTRRDKTRMDGVGIVFEFYIAPL